MKNLMITTILVFFASCLYAQDHATQDEIKQLEQKEVQAVLATDSVVLKKLWDKNYVVNNPENRIVPAVPNSVSRPVLQRARTSFIREVELITINGDVAVSMGNETVVPAGDLPNAGQAVKRRYTNIWMRKDGAWKLIARHANVICREKE